MNLERYEYAMKSTDVSIEYKFYSQGPRGMIRKFIHFDKISDNYYNLSFGDLTSQAGTFLDETVSNNKDAEKVLITVAHAVLNFTKEQPEAIIYAEGSSSGRSRLYRIYINKYWKIISRYFYIYGTLADGSRIKFRKDKDFISFLVIRKNR